MNTEAVIYDVIKEVLPKGSLETVLFAAVTDTSSETFFYSYFSGEDEPKQCYQMAEDGQGGMDSGALDKAFEAVTAQIRKSREYQSGKLNIATLRVDSDRAVLSMEVHEKKTGLYKIKKEWKKKNLINS